MGFEDLAYLFTCDNRNRGIIRMNFDEAALLWDAVRYAVDKRRGPVLEIGRKYGGSLALLHKATDVWEVPIYSVDLKNELEVVLEPERINILVQDSRKIISNKDWSFILFDGDHSYDGVAADVRAHWPQLKTGGLAAFHDADGQVEGRDYCAGVRNLLGKLAAHGTLWGRAGSLVVLEKFSELPEGF